MLRRSLVNAPDSLIDEIGDDIQSHVGDSEADRGYVGPVNFQKERPYDDEDEESREPRDIPGRRKTEMDSKRELTKKIMTVLDRLASMSVHSADKAPEKPKEKTQEDLKPAEKRKLQDLMKELADLMAPLKEVKDQIVALNKEAKAIGDSVAGDLAPLQSLMAELNNKYDQWRKKYEETIVDRLSQINKLSEESSVAAEWLRARLAKRTVTDDEMTTINDVIELLGTSRGTGAFAKKLEGLRDEFQKNVDSQFETWKVAHHKIAVALVDAASIAEKKSKDAKNAVEKAAADEAAAKEKGAAAEALAQYKQIREEAAARSKAADAEAKALSKAGDAVAKKAESLKGGKKSSLVTAELSGEADHAIDFLNTSADSLIAALDMIIAEMAPISQMSQIMASAPVSTEEAPAEVQQVEEVEPVMDEAPAEVEDPALVAAGLVESAEKPVLSDAEAKKVEALKKEIRVLLGKITPVRQQARAVQELIAGIKPKPAIDPGKTKIEKPVEKMTPEEKALRLKQIEVEKKPATEKRKDTQAEVDALKAELLDLMEKFGIKKASLSEVIEARLVQIGEEEQNKMKADQAAQIQIERTNADKFQGWLVQANKVTEEENAMLLRVMEHLQKNKTQTEPTLNVERQPGTPVPQKQREKVLEDIKKQKPAPAPSKTKTMLSILLSRIAEADLEQVLKDAKFLAEELTDLDPEGDKGLAGTLNAIGNFEMEVSEAEEAPAAPANEDRELALSNNLEDAWTREADVKLYPSEYDLSGGVWDLVDVVEADGSGDGEKKQQFVINKDLKARITKKVKDIQSGAFKPGQSVMIDNGDHFISATIKAYAGEGMYDVDVNGEEMRGPAECIFVPREDLWR